MTAGRTPLRSLAHGDLEGFLDGDGPARGEVAAGVGAGIQGIPWGPTGSPATAPHHPGVALGGSRAYAVAAAALRAEDNRVYLLHDHK